MNKLLAHTSLHSTLDLLATVLLPATLFSTGVRLSALAAGFAVHLIILLATANHADSMQVNVYRYVPPESIE